MGIEGRFRRVDLAQGGGHVPAQRLQVRAAGQQLERERRRQRLLERRQRYRMDRRHALRIGADQRPQGFTILGQHPLGANDLLAGGELFGLGVGHIHAILHTALGPVLVGRHRELGNALQLLQQRDFLECRLHGEIELRHAAGDVELNAGGLRQPGVFLANGGGDPGAIGSPEIDIQLRPDANGVQRIPRTVLIHRQGVGVGPAKGFVGDPQAVLRRDGGGLQAHRRLGEFHRRLRLGDAQPGGLHGRRILQRPIDQHIELRVIVGLPPAGCRPVAVRQVDHLRQLGLLRIDDGDLGRLVLNQRAAAEQRQRQGKESVAQPRGERKDHHDVLACCSVAIGVGPQSGRVASAAASAGPKGLVRSVASGSAGAVASCSIRSA